MTFKTYLDAAIDAALNAGAYLKEHYHTSHHIHSKSHINDIVTECDKTSEEMIKSKLKMLFPNHSFLCEESGSSGEFSQPLWIIDPLDGTVNFAKKIPFFCVSIALCIEEEIVIGVIYSPMTSELFYAQKDQGAFLNDQKIHVTQCSLLNHAFGATGFPYRIQDNVGASLHPIEKLLSLGTPLRRLGSAALDLAYVASGRFDLFFEAYLEAWDYAAGALLVKEAGGTISDFQNKPLNYKKSSSICATNTALHEAMIREVLT